MIFRFSLQALLLCALLLISGCRKSQRKELHVLCAAALRVPLEAAARQWEAEGGGPVRLQFGGSQTMLSMLELSGKGDVFLPADISYIQVAEKKDLTAGSVALAEMSAVLVVGAGNPKRLLSLAELQQPGVRLVLANPELAAISQQCARSLPEKTWQDLLANAVVMKPTVSDVANDVALGAADAGIVWDVTARQTSGVETVRAAALTAVKGVAAGAVCRNSPEPAVALQFLQWLASPEKGGVIFAAGGYAPASP